MELDDIKSILNQLSAETVSDNITQKEKTTLAVNIFQMTAEKRNILLKLNKKK